MNIALLRETKEHEGRVALTPPQVKRLVLDGHRVSVQKGAGFVAGFTDKKYAQAGARILSSKRALIQKADLILKVKEPEPSEIAMMKKSQMVFCFLHLAALPGHLKLLLRRKVIALAYETVQLADGTLPLLRPMSEIAGQLATQNGAHFLRSDQGGRGLLLGGTSRVRSAEVVVLGAGTVGENATKIAVGMGATTHVVDVSQKKLNAIKRRYGCRVYLSSRKKIAGLIKVADLVVGAVLIPGARAPKLVTESMVKKMKKGSVIVDVAVDQGGCVATSEVTSHEKPVVIKHGILHYGVPNIPAVVPVTATLALTQATFPYIRRLANLGLARCCRRYPEMLMAINCVGGEIAHPALLVS